MADSSVAITAGSGTTIDTRTESTNSNHRQVIVIGDPSANAGVAPVDGTAGLKVDLGADNDVVVTNAGTFATQSAVTAASGAFASGSIASGAVVDGAMVTIGTKADAKSTATDTTAVSAMSVWKQISASIQAAATSLAGTLTVASHAVTNAGTFAVQAASAGDVSSGSSDSGNPVKVGGLAKTALPTAVSDGQRVAALHDKFGRRISIGALRELKAIQQTQISNSTSETTIVTAVASNFCDLYGLILANTGASTTKVTIRDSTAGTVRAIIEVPTLETRGFMLSVDSAIPQASVNNNWTAQCGTATTALEVTAFYVKNT